MLVHWDEVEKVRRGSGGVGGTWTGLSRAAGSRGVGMNRIEIDPGKASTPPHVHLGVEEMFYVLGGSGWSLQDGSTHDVRAGDCVVHRPNAEAHTLLAGDEGLDVLAWGPPPLPLLGYVPHARAVTVSRALGVWLEAAPEGNPWEDAPIERGESEPRPPSIVNLDDAPSAFGGIVRRLAHGAGAQDAGLNRVALPPGEEGAPPHCHSAEEEIFVVLDGGGTLELWAPPQPAAAPASQPSETHELRPGHVVARPPGTRISHALRAGEGGLTYLAYGTRDTSDVCYYPRSNKIFFRGVGLVARLEPLDYFDGEPA